MKNYDILVVNYNRQTPSSKAILPQYYRNIGLLAEKATNWLPLMYGIPSPAAVIFTDIRVGITSGDGGNSLFIYPLFINLFTFFLLLFCF